MSDPNLHQNIKQDWVENDIVMPVHMNNIGENINNVNSLIPVYSANGSFYTIQSISGSTYNLKPVVYTDDSINLAPTSYFEGMEVCFKLQQDNLANCKVNVNNLGAKSVKTADNTELDVSYLTAGNYMTLRFDSTQNCFYLVSTPASGGLEIGDIGIAFLGIDESKNKRRYLNGQVISQTQFPSFTNWVKARIQIYTHAVCSESEWQNEVNLSTFGQCGKVVINDEDGTIRLPKVVNIQGCQDLANNLGVRLPESLPNIVANIRLKGVYNGEISTSGAFKLDGVTTGSAAQYGGGSSQGISFDASESSSTYQEDAPVQQESIQYPFYIQVAQGGKKSIDTTEEYTINNPFSLFDCQYDYKERENSSWLLSNGQRNDGTLYASAYEELLRVYGTTEKKIGLASVKLVSDSSATDYDFKIDTSSQEFILPTKTYYTPIKDNAGVKGNGMTLGLTDGTDNYGFVNINGLSTRLDNYGEPAGSSYSNYGIAPNKTIGITTDSSKSGIIIDTDTTGSYLYYYVGDTNINPTLVNAGQVFNAISKKAEIQNDVNSLKNYLCEVRWSCASKSNWVISTTNFNLGNFSIGTDNVTVPTSGLYYFSLEGKHPSNANGSDYLTIQVNGEEKYRIQDDSAQSSDTINGYFNLNTGDIIQVVSLLGGWGTDTEGFFSIQRLCNKY